MLLWESEVETKLVLNSLGWVLGYSIPETLLFEGFLTLTNERTGTFPAYLGMKIGDLEISLEEAKCTTYPIELPR